MVLSSVANIIKVVNVVVTTNSGRKIIFIVFDLWTLVETMEN